MTKPLPQSAALDPMSVEARRGTIYPDKFKPLVAGREKRALGNALGLVNFGVNLTKLESRPQPGAPWEYLFHVDVEGRDADPRLAAEAAMAIHDDLSIPEALPRLAAWLAKAPSGSTEPALRQWPQTRRPRGRATSIAASTSAAAAPSSITRIRRPSTVKVRSRIQCL